MTERDDHAVVTPVPARSALIFSRAGGVTELLLLVGAEVLQARSTDPGAWAAGAGWLALH
jgi:hypothetical protein